MSEEGEAKGPIQLPPPCAGFQPPGLCRCELYCSEEVWLSPDTPLTSVLSQRAAVAPVSRSRLITFVRVSMHASPFPDRPRKDMSSVGRYTAVGAPQFHWPISCSQRGD